MELRAESSPVSREASPEPTLGPRNKFPGRRNGTGWLEPKDGTGSVLEQEGTVRVFAWLAVLAG